MCYCRRLVFFRILLHVSTRKYIEYNFKMEPLSKVNVDQFMSAPHTNTCTFEMQWSLTVQQQQQQYEQ